MWIYANPNPKNKEVPDCVIRAICIALNKSWLEVSDELYWQFAREEYSVTCDDNVWGRYLFEHGFEAFSLPSICPKCTTVYDFTKMYPDGTYIVGTGMHAVAVIDGNYYDSWDSGDQICTFYWRRRAYL
jgi:hypothetical protein